ncbi:hypothetical protein K438DRAFT_1964118 [Mycena galopus ATCC 62051]|nr:hypothetical protein K438DRAFT_1964118 [Mycena galopus ATCC 62051]
MAHPLFWPGKRYFYAFGNTSAVSLARDVTPDQDISLLLLGCGDPRNILFTLFSEHDAATRKLDFTCIDFEPAVLARNVLLLSMVIDTKDAESIFDIFFHFYLDKDPLALVVSQCRALLDVSTTLQSWRGSSYGSTLRMSSQHTLDELRWHWGQYAGMHALPDSRLQTIVANFRSGVAEYQDRRKGPYVAHTSRSAGPIMMHPTVMKILSDCFYDFWKYGTTFVSVARRSAATLLNPTFVYTQAGVGCHVHYGSDPVMPFHLAPIFGNLIAAPSRSHIVDGIRAQFKDWCAAFRRHHERRLCIVRFFFADAILGARALQACKESGPVKTRIHVCQWRAEIIALDKEEYKHAPLTFDVVDTSNLHDHHHIGLLNVLVISIPLLPSSGDGVLYLESLLVQGHVDNAPKDFTMRFRADLTVMSILFRLSPVDFMTGYSTRSNTHELMAHKLLDRTLGPQQYHQVTTWKTARGDPPVIDSRQLGTFLYDLYHALFEEEDVLTFYQRHNVDTLSAISTDSLSPYSRETFVMLLKFIRDRLQIPPEEWIAVIDRFFSIQRADSSRNMDTINYQDFCGLLHFHGVHTMDLYRQEDVAHVGIFSAWSKVPPLVRVFLTVPREKLGILTGVTPILEAGMRSPLMANRFSSVHAAFGTLSTTGTLVNPKAFFEDDPDGFRGTKPLVISFVMPAMLLAGDGPRYDLPRDIRIVLEIYSARLFDKTSVLILPEQPLPSGLSTSMRAPAFGGQIGSQGPIHVIFNDECDLIESFSVKLDVEDGLAKTALQSKGDLIVQQISYNAVQLVLGGKRQTITRKSLWIELIVPPRPSLPQMGAIVVDPFPIAIRDLVPLSVHRVNLERLPVLNLNTPGLDEWLIPHVGLTFSEREAKARKNKDVDTLMFVKDTIQTIMVLASGIQPKGSSPQRVFALRDKTTNNCDTILFIDLLRFDLSAHTIVCDGFVLPLTEERVTQDYWELVPQMAYIPLEPGEIISWKQLLPVLVERCRTWKHRDSCQYAVEDSVPLSTEMEDIPLCACGEGQDVQRMRDVPLWKPLAKHCTRIALSPFFGVSYLEPVGPKDRSCCVCRAKAPFRCPKCKKDRYCGS